MTTLLFDVIARDRASKTFKSVGHAADESAGKFNRWKAAGAVAGAVVGAALIKFGKDSVAAYKDSQQSQVQLQNAFKRFPALADVQIASLRRLNSELEKKTGFDDDATASGQAILAQFKLTGTQIQQLTPLLQDYATRTGKDLPTAAQDLGKAVLGQGRALKNVGVNFKDTGSAAGNFDEIMTGLRGTVGGFAEQQGKTAAGQTKILSAEFGELEETVGSKLVPALTSLVGVGIKVIDFVQRNGKAVGITVGILGGLAVAVWAVNAAARAYVATQAALNIVLSANPIGIIIIAVAALVAGLIIAYKHSETFRNIVNAAFHSVQAVVGAVVGFIRAHWKLLFAILTGPVGLGIAWVVTHFSTVKSAVSKALHGVASAITAPFRTAFGIIMAGFHAIESAWNRISSIVNGGSATPRGAAAAVGAASGRGIRGARAMGGPVTAGSAYIVGEHRPEVFVPDSNGTILPGVGGGGSTVINITVNGAVDKQATARQIVSVLQDYVRATGKPLQVRTA